MKYGIGRPLSLKFRSIDLENIGLHFGNDSSLNLAKTMKILKMTHDYYGEIYAQNETKKGVVLVLEAFPQV